MEITVTVRAMCSGSFASGYAPVSLPEGARVRDLLERYYDSVPGQLGMTKEEFLQSASAAVNQNITGHDTPLQGGDKVLILQTAEGG